MTPNDTPRRNTETEIEIDINLIIAAHGYVVIFSRFNILLHKLLQPLVGDRVRLTIKPDDDESHKAGNNRPQTCNPNPATADLPAARVLIVREVADGDFVPFVDVGEERTLVVDVEGEDPVLVRKSERGAVDCAVLGAGSRLERKTVVRGEHGELNLDGVVWFNLEWNIVAAGVLGQFNVVGLVTILARKHHIVGGPSLEHTTSFLTLYMVGLSSPEAPGSSR